MRILLQTYAFWPVWGGVQKNVEFLYNALQKEGHKVKVATANYVVMDNNEKYVIPPWQKYKKVKLRRFLFLSDHYLKSRNISTLKRFVFRLWYELSFLRYLVFLFFFRPEIIHINFINVDADFTLRARKYLPFKIFTTCRGNDILTYGGQSMPRKALTKQLLGASDLITGVSDEICNEIRNILGGGNLPNIKTIRNGIVLPSIPKSFSGEFPAKYFLFVGRLSDKKNPIFLIESFVDFLKINSDYSLVLIGDGPLKAQAFELIDASSLKSKVFILGSLPHETTLLYTSRAAALILPSAYGEGCPNVLLEAMALKTPVIGSNTSGIRELITDNKYGLLFELNNKTSLVKTLTRIVSDQELREQLVNNSKKLVDDFYDHKKVTKNYLTLYQELADKKITKSIFVK